MLRCIFTFIVLICAWICVSGAVNLRKHRYQMHSAKEEPTVVRAMHQQEQQPKQDNESSDRRAELHNFHHDEACGEATLSCMAFAHDQTDIPVRCGMLSNAPLCRDNDQECAAFCDADGGSRVCEYAFAECCKHSPNGCITSSPLHVKLY
ncbi:hypothetical protein BJV82DRAFT_609659, partial [Fennellomyces sp. T-0311]